VLPVVVLFDRCLSVHCRVVVRWLGSSFVVFLTRPEKTLQLLLLILIFIYKVNVSPDMILQLHFFSCNNSSTFVLNEAVHLRSELYPVYGN